MITQAGSDCCWGRRSGLKLRKIYVREALGLMSKAERHAHVRQFKRMRWMLRRQRTLLGRVSRDVGRQLNMHPGCCPRADSGVAGAGLSISAANSRRTRISSMPCDLHAPKVESIGKGSARRPCDFEVQVGLR